MTVEMKQEGRKKEIKSAQKEKPALPSELSKIPEGLTHLAGLDTELEALILYLYLKEHKYPVDCTFVFKRSVRRKARLFSLYEYEGDEGENWCLFYKEEVKKWPRVLGSIKDSKELTGNMKMERADDVEGPLETKESKRTEDSKQQGEVLQIPVNIGSEKTLESDASLPKASLKIRNGVATVKETRKKLFVFRKAEKETILKHMHLKGGKNGEHASRDRIVEMVIPYFYWRDLRKDVMDIIMKCEVCQMKRNALWDVMDSAIHHQDSKNVGHQTLPEKDPTAYRLPCYVQTYLENAMRIDGWWEVDDLPPGQGNIVDSKEPHSKEYPQTVHGPKQDEGTRDFQLSHRHMCDRCPRGFVHLDSLLRHKRTEHRNRQNLSRECSVCGMKTTELCVHMRTHTKEKPYECDICGKRYAFRSAFRMHIKKHSGYKPFRCSDCPMQYASRYLLKVHFRSSHEGRGEYQCDVCEKIFITQFRLDVHKRVHSKPKFICEECGKILANPVTLKNHRLIHTGERHVLCEICGKGFKKKDDLNKHIEHHLGIKKHQCHVCQQRFCLKGDLQDHLRVHEGASRYECDICHRKFMNKRSVARCKRKHGSRAAAATFQCNYCGVVLKTLEDFRRHTAAHQFVEGAKFVQHEVEIE